MHFPRSRACSGRVEFSALVWEHDDTGIRGSAGSRALVAPDLDDDERAMPLKATPYFGFVWEESNFRFWQTHTAASDWPT